LSKSRCRLRRWSASVALFGPSWRSMATARIILAGVTAFGLSSTCFVMSSSTMVFDYITFLLILANQRKALHFMTFRTFLRQRRAHGTILYQNELQ
jgi:hypothetical protein